MLLAPSASAVVVRGAHGHLLGVTPRRGVTVNRLAAAAAPRVAPTQSSAQMTYHGGPVLHSSSPYLVLWDPNRAIPSDWQQLLQRYFGDVATADPAWSDVYAVDRQYWDGSGYAAASQSFAPAGQVVPDSDSFPGLDAANCPDTSTVCITDAQVQQELAHLLRTQGLPADGPTGSSTFPANAPIYYVVLPPNVDACYAGADGSAQCAAHDYCSYHSSFVDGGEEVLYALIPSLVLATNPKACQLDGNSALQEPNTSLADVMLKYLTHEATETITDPLLTAWWSSVNANEVADNCNQTGPYDPAAGSNPKAFLPTLGGSAGSLYDQTINGHNYYLQSVWSNAARDCAMAPTSGTVTAQFATTTSPPYVTNTALSFDPTGSSSTNPYSSVTWDWGDGSVPAFTHGTAGPSTTSHTYAKAGNYTVTLTLVDNQGNVGTSTDQIVVYSPPTASFTFSPAQPFAEDPVQFDASSSSDPDPGVTITDYQWDYGDGNTDSGVTPSPHTYTTPGTYTVTLTITNSAGVTSRTQQQVTVVAEPPQASFTIDPTGAAIGQPVSFAASASDPHANITSYRWDFGDGTTPTIDASSATTDSTSHPYGQSGTYTVTLTVGADNGTSTTVARQLTVGPVAAFTSTPPQPVFGTPVTFDASSSTDPEQGQTITSYAWDFGDGSTGSGPNPSHSYAHPGTYTVALTVENSPGNESNTVSHLVTVGDIPPNAAFSVTTPVPAPGQPVGFDGTASAPSDPSASIVSYAWRFGDGATGSGPTPTHTYSSSGTYTAELTVTDSYGASSSLTRQVVVHALPAAAFTTTPAHPLAQTPAGFNAGSSRDSEAGVRIASYAWGFGDGATGSGATPSHAYAKPGTYTVALTVANSLGLRATTTHVVQVVAPPHAGFSLRTRHPASGQPIGFASSSTDPWAAIVSYRWTFGDHTAPAAGAGPSHVYGKPGSYPVTLTVTDAFGHSATATTRVSVALAGRITRVTVSRAGTKLRVTLNAPGLLSALGRTVHVRKAGTVTLPIRLTAAQQRRLATSHTLTVRLVVRFAPTAGARQTQTVIVMFRPARAASARLTRGR
jgi:PKD repeat protein